ncbi:PREDICTED: transcription factor A, mitochondrial isoform X1 [Cyphomyrmex costatus]|uniref:transcription factor A, mitochondrial isoform X1 n=1 Tax=Cyphomyrmex costatus TaxID=456900 RepID=UPI0008522414|nr:PREDICTED: transcription factor A, mitochondrial isoform X1 [Cyphomyrmex costatus]
MIMATWRLLSPINRKQFNLLNFFCTREFASAQNFTTSKSKQNIEKDSIPPKPKKPPSVFLLYYNSIRNKLQKEYPHCKPKELSKIVSEKWAQIDPTEKQNLQKQFREQTSIYKQKLMDYENSLTNEQKIEIIQKLLKKGHTLKQGEIKQKLIELGKPKRPLPAFMLFMQSKKSTKNPQESYKDWLNNVINEWKNMTVEAKNKYNAEASDLFKNYKIEVEKWKEEMIQADQQHESTKGMVLCGNKNILKTTVECSRKIAVNTSINDVKKSIVQPQDTHTYIQIYTYFVSTWKRVLIVLKEISENWKTKLY